jgi:hypothetical protein
MATRPTFMTIDTVSYIQNWMRWRRRDVHLVILAVVNELAERNVAFRRLPDKIDDRASEVAILSSGSGRRFFRADLALTLITTIAFG